MAKSFPVGFRIHIPEPIEVKMVSPTLAVRNAIHPFERYKGLFTYVVEDDTFYYLSGGITDEHWKPIGKAELLQVEVFDEFNDTPGNIISGYGLKNYLEQNYMNANEVIQAIEAVMVPNHVKAITASEINKWNLLQTDKNLVYIQTFLSMTWTVTHSFGKIPAVQVFLSDGRKIEPDIFHVDNNTVLIQFSKPTKGFVTFN